jgi:hypothetical protein
MGLGSSSFTFYSFDRIQVDKSTITVYYACRYFYFIRTDYL